MTKKKKNNDYAGAFLATHLNLKRLRYFLKECGPKRASSTKKIIMAPFTSVNERRQTCTLILYLNE